MSMGWCVQTQMHASKIIFKILGGKIPLVWYV